MSQSGQITTHRPLIYDLIFCHSLSIYSPNASCYHCMMQYWHSVPCRRRRSSGWLSQPDLSLSSHLLAFRSRRPSILAESCSWAKNVFVQPLQQFEEESRTISPCVRLRAEWAGRLRRSCQMLIVQSPSGRNSTIRRAWLDLLEGYQPNLCTRFYEWEGESVFVTVFQRW